MIWGRQQHRKVAEAGALARLQHSRWLTRALEGAEKVPRIPVRRVDEGGFAALASMPSGPAQAERWWRLAMERLHGVS